MDEGRTTSPRRTSKRVGESFNNGVQKLTADKPGTLGKLLPRSLDTFARRNIPGNFRRADDYAFMVFDRRYGQRDLQDLAIFAHALCVEVANPLRAGNSSQGSRLLQYGDPKE